jgi:cobalt-zinc-cadmium efflux system membrane fusion protein
MIPQDDQEPEVQTFPIAEESRPNEQLIDPLRHTVPLQASTSTASLSRQIVYSLIGIAVVGLLLAVFRLSASAKEENKTDAQPSQSNTMLSVSDAGKLAVQLTTGKVSVELPHEVVRATAIVQFSPDNQIKISPRLQGRVRQVLVHVGDVVHPGQTLVILDSVDAVNALTAQRQAQNRLRLAETALARAQRQYALGTPDVTAAMTSLDQAKAHTLFTKATLENVKAQSKIGGFADKPLTDAEGDAAQAKSDLAQAQKDVDSAQREQDRTSRLVDIGVAARRDLEAAEVTLAKSQATLTAAIEKARIAEKTLDRERKAFQANLYSAQQERQAQSDFVQAQLQEDAAVRALALARAAVRRDLEQAESDYHTAQVDVANATEALTLYSNPKPDGSVTITSPTSGIVTERDVNPGQIVDQSQMTPWQMLTIVNNRSVIVDADVFEKDLSGIHPGIGVKVTSDALPGYLGVSKVTYVAPALDPKTHALKVRTTLDNRDGRLKDGMYVSVALTPDTKDRQVTRTPVIDLSSVVHDSGKDYVYLVQPDGKYLRQEVKLGAARDEGRVAVESGLSGGETIVTRGALYLGSVGN